MPFVCVPSRFQRPLRAHRALRVLPIITAVLALSSAAGAVGTRTFDLDSMDELSGGDLKGVSISSDGTVRAGWTLGSVPLTDATTVFSSLALADGSVLLGTSPGGKVIRVANDRATLFADTKELAVTSLAQDKSGTIYAGTMPNGKVFKLGQGAAEVYATIPGAQYVWALAMDKTKGTLYASVGPDGRVFRVDAGDKSQLVYKSDQTHLISLAIADNGDIFTGSSGKGLLYRIPAPGTGTAGSATVVYDFPGDEVKAIAFTPGGTMYVIDNEYAEAPEVPTRHGVSSRPAGPTTPSRAKPGKGTLYRFDAQWHPERMMHHDEFHYLSLAIDPQTSAPYVGTGAEGRVYTVDDTHIVTLLADTDERQVGAIGVAKGGGVFVATSDPATYHGVIGQGGKDAVWTSKVHDAGLRARFGTMTWRATGALELSTRTGNTLLPDATWSAWSNGITQAGLITSPIGRYVQVRARWGNDPKATLSEVVLPFITENLRPIVLEVSAHQPGAHDTSATSAPPEHDNTVHVTWKVDNPDLDTLRYRLSYRREGETASRDITRPDEVVTKLEYKWETSTIPEGKYRVKVEASDEQANPPDQVLKHALESSPVLVDNTPPTLQLSITGRRLRAHAVDGLGPIVRVEMTVDGRLDWRPLAPVDGLFDTADESVDTDVSSLVPPGTHIVAVRAFDAAGNSTVKEVEAR